MPANHRRPAGRILPVGLVDPPSHRKTGCAWNGSPFRAVRYQAQASGCHPMRAQKCPKTRMQLKKFHKPELLTWQFSSFVALPLFLVALHPSTFCAIAWPRPVSSGPMGSPRPGSRDRKSRAVPWPRRRSSRLGSLTFFLFPSILPSGPSLEAANMCRSRAAAWP